MQTKRKGFVLICVGVLASVSAVGPRRAWSAPLPGANALRSAAIESPIGRALLGEMPEGLELMSRALGRTATRADVDEFVRYLHESHPSRLAELESRIAGIREEMNQARAARNGGKAVDETQPFDDIERMVLRLAAKDRLKFDRRAISRDAVSGEITFASESDTGFNASRGKFLADEPSGLRLGEAQPASELPEAIRARGRRSLIKWARDAQSCLENRPESASKKAEFSMMLQQLGITAGVTTVGTVMETGISRINPAAFSYDLAMSLFTTGVNMRWMKSRNSSEVRWLKGFAVGQTRNIVDFELYQILPWIEAPAGHGKLDAAEERLAFNAKWTLETSWVSPAMFLVVGGAECMMNESAASASAKKWFARGAFGFRLGVSIGSSILYYHMRARKTGQ